MKFTVELDMSDYMDNEGFYEDSLRKDVSRHIAEQLAGILAKEGIKLIDFDKEVKEAKELYESAVRDAKEKRLTDMALVDEKIGEVFTEFLSGTAIITNKWGEPKETCTIGEYIRRRAEEILESKKTEIEKRITDAVVKRMKISEYEIEQLIERKSREIGNENAKKVAEFIMKGAF